VLVPPRDPAALAAAIGGLLDDRAELERLALAARATIERSFSWARCGAETLAAYEDALR
jgi:glycosyltransferase involved in cell wall biosynthesis